jgi:phage-related protein
MAQVSVLFYKDKFSDACPSIEWLVALDRRSTLKCLAVVELLREQGHRLGMPYAKVLRDGIYELRTRSGNTQYRILFFFYGTNAVVLSHGLAKEKDVPQNEIDRAVERKRRFEADPADHVLQE